MLIRVQSAQHRNTHLQCGSVLSECPCFNIPYHETTKKHEETTPSIRFHIYHIIGRFTAHARIPLKDKKICYMCEQ